MIHTDITSFEIACKVLNREAVLPDVSKMPSALGKYLTDHTKLITIIEAMNFVEENWKPDYFRQNEKFSAWPDVESDEQRPGGFALSDAHYDYVLTFTGVGSRLQTKTSKMIVWAQEQFPDLFISNYLIIE